MSKKKHNPVKALKHAFQQVWDDNELHDRYERFEIDLETAKNEHNELVPIINDNLQIIRTLKESVLEQALCGVLSTDATVKIKELEAKNEELIKKIDSLRKVIDENKGLIKKYKDWSGRKLFVWWQAIKAVDPETEPWLEWKNNRDSKIF